MSAAVALRAATPVDVPRIAALVDAAYRKYLDRLPGPSRPMTLDYAEVVRRDRVVLAERDGALVGLLVMAVEDDRFVMDNLAVDPAHQGTGVGRLLMEHAEAEARRAGFSAIHTYTNEKMTENRALYERIGYVQYDRRQHGPMAAVYLRKPLR